MLIQKKINYIRFDQKYKSLDDYAVVSVFGEDSRDFLQKQLTSDVDALLDSQFQHSAILDIGGRLVSAFYLLRESINEFVILVSVKILDSTLDRLNLYLISEDVEIKQVEKNFHALFGVNLESKNSFSGRMFNENCVLATEKPKNIKEIDEDDFKLLSFCSGEATVGLEAVAGDLFVNSFLTETALSMKKGCFPGQETVSKIMNNKGASKFPVCLVSKEYYDKEEIILFEKKIGAILKFVQVQDEYYYYALVNREYRIENYKFDAEGISFSVHYFPLINNSNEDKAKDLFYSAVEEFQKDNLEIAIEQLELALTIDPEFEDAYESLGVIYGRIGENHKAIELMHKLAKLNDKSVMAHTNLSLYYMKVGEIKLAEEHKAEATIKQFEVLGDEAQAKRDKEQKELAQKEEQVRKEGMFKQVLEIDSEDALANFGMGEIEFNNQNYLASEKYLIQAIETDPKYSVAYLALAKTYVASQKSDELFKILEKGIKISTGNGDLMPANEMQQILNQNS